MNQKPITIISGTLIALSLMLGGSQLRAQSEAASSPINLTVALAGSSNVVLGEPVLLKYVVNNTGAQKTSGAEADVKRNPLITERFTDATGKMLVPSVNPIPPRRVINGMIPSSDLIDLTNLNGNTSRSWETVASAYVTFPHPGHYVLRVHVQDPYVIGDDEQGPRQLLTGDYAFPLNVLEAKPAYLRATAERLRSSVLTTTDVNVSAMLVKALFSMPEDTASASWQALVEEPRLDGSSLNQIGTALARIHTIRATDILAEMIWEPVQPRDVLNQASPGRDLMDVYDTGDAALRTHIEELHKQRGMGMPNYRLQ